MQDNTEILRLLFISKVRIKALRYFLLNPQSEIHLRAAVREFEEEINAVRRELTRLAEINLLISAKRGNKKFYKVNRESLVYDDLANIFHKIFGAGGAIIRNEQKLGEISFALLTEPFLEGNISKQQQIDMVLIGKIDLITLEKLMAKVEKELDREVNYTVMTDREFSLKKKRRDQFIVDLVLGRHVLLIGNKEKLIN